MNGPIRPERREIELPVRPGISEDLVRLREEGWNIEHMRLRQAEGILEVTAVRPRGAGGSRDEAANDG